ncbi:hypothetical protein KC19_4G054900 [Ceratodon purpureus]|uniref:Ubiquitin-like domain-containing protein n=1 Tax=Ceratodon purpureus TaxID=3225 RepID=A0A8T0I8R8_CERPU|nr:hypothetical protein KC19_4G054900 [Ceratodon purpureus]
MLLGTVAIASVSDRAWGILLCAAFIIYIFCRNSASLAREREREKEAPALARVLFLRRSFRFVSCAGAVRVRGSRWCSVRASAGIMIEVVLNDRLGKKVRVKCNQDDTIGDLKKLVAAQTGTRPEKIRIQKWYTIYKDHITLADYEIHDGMGLELYYN